MDLLWNARAQYGWKELRSEPRDLEAEEKLLYKDRKDSGSVDESSVYSSPPIPERRRSTHCMSFWLTLLNLVVFCATAVLSSSSIRQQWRKGFNTCVREISPYSPFIESKPVDFHHEKVNGTIWPPTDPTWQRKEPNDPETEAMWTFFEDVQKFHISSADAVGLGKDPEILARFPDEVFGLGDDAFVASLDIQHKLHCLNNLRQMAFASYGDNPSKKKQHGQLWWLHLRHCLDIVTEDLICHADADIVTYHWTDIERYPFPDFSVNRKCRNIHDLIRWRDERTVNMEVYKEAMVKPSGVPLQPHEPGYYAAYGFYWSELYPNGTGYTEELPDTKHWFGLPPTPDH